MVTIEEIAKLSQRSTSTVSKALNGYPEISEKTRKKIVDIATELGYTPNATAQSLVRRRSNTIGVVYEVEAGLRNLFFSSVLEAFRKHVEAKGYDILLLSHNTKSGLDYLRHCKSKNVDAVLIVSGGQNLESTQKLRDSDLSIFTLDPFVEQTNSIYSNNFKAIRKACRYLYELGHKKIAFISGDKNNFIGKERLLGYLNFIGERDLEPILVEEINNVSYNYDEGYNTMKAIFENYGLPEAVCASSDLMAIGAISYLQTHGYHVPNDVSVIGFDNLQVCEIVTPKLTTICQDFETIGAKACEALMHMIESGERVLDPIVVDTSIVVRDSCIKRK